MKITFFMPSFHSYAKLADIDDTFTSLKLKIKNSLLLISIIEYPLLSYINKNILYYYIDMSVLPKHRYECFTEK